MLAPAFRAALLDGFPQSMLLLRKPRDELLCHQESCLAWTRTKPVLVDFLHLDGAEESVAEEA